MLKAFKLPLPMIQEIVEYANENYTGNAFILAVDVFRDFLKAKRNE